MTTATTGTPTLTQSLVQTQDIEQVYLKTHNAKWYKLTNEDFRKRGYG